MSSANNQKGDGAVVLTGREKGQRTNGFWIALGILAVMLVAGIVLLSVRANVLRGGPAALRPQQVERIGPDGHPLAPAHSDLVDDPAPTLPVPDSR